MQISPLEIYFIDQGREYRSYDVLTKTKKTMLEARIAFIMLVFLHIFNLPVFLGTLQISKA